MEITLSVAEQLQEAGDEKDRVRLLRAVGQGLADDAAGRTMDTKSLKASLEKELGPITWP